MSQDIYRVPIRFNLKNPEHSKIVGVLQNLEETKNSTKSGFIIEALSYYIKLISNSPLAGKGLLNGESGALVTKQDLEIRLSFFQKEMKLYLLEKILPMISTGVSPAEILDDENEDKKPSGPIDISQDPDIMSSISSWMD